MTEESVAGLDVEVVFAASELNRIAAYDVHPIKPWLLTAHDNANIVLWDYERKAVLHEFSLNSIDDDKKDAVLLQKQVEKDPEYKGPRIGDQPIRQDKPGGIKCVRFFDEDCRSWKRIFEV